MNAEKYFKEMFFYIWQGYDLNKIDMYYAKDFEEIVGVSDKNNMPLELKMNYDDLTNQAKWYKENYKDVTLNIKKIIVNPDNYISVNFYSSAIDRKTGELKHRLVSGIWQLNTEDKINHVWAVVTPYYPN